MPNILVSGSIAYDYIMDFPDSFKNHILHDQVHILNLSFNVPELRREFGGNVGNIAYTSKLLGGETIAVSALGTDGDSYRQYLLSLGIPTDHIISSTEKLTAAAYITTDRDDNQIAAFFIGPLPEAVEVSVHDIKETPALAIISPTVKEVMIKHAKECAEKNIPIVFDPGQSITSLSAQELMLLIGQAKFLIGNDYELKLLQERTRWNTKELFNHAEVIITTLGEKGSVISTKNEIIPIAPCPPHSVDDPTGAGDAYRAGFFTAYVNSFDLTTCGQVGSVAATYAVEHYGTQNHRFTRDEFARRYEKTYGEKLRLT